MGCSKVLSCRQFFREFHYSRLWFTHNDWRAFAYIPWLPYKWPFQLGFMIYRWIIALYFLAWLIVSGAVSGGPLWFIYLTHWCAVVFVVYLMTSALSVTAKFFSEHVWSKCSKSPQEHDIRRQRDYLFNKPTGCCGYSSNQLSWYQMIHWLSFNIGAEAAVIVLVLYWTAVYGGGFVDGVNANLHAVNGVISLVDMWIIGVPVSILHFIYPLIFSSSYAVFTGVYFVTNGTNPDGGRSIYPILNYDGNATMASILVVCLAVIFVSVVHLFFYAMYMARFWLVYLIYGRSKAPCVGYEADHDEAEDLEKVEMT